MNIKIRAETLSKLALDDRHRDQGPQSPWFDSILHLLHGSTQFLQLFQQKLIRRDSENTRSDICNININTNEMPNL
jgi:hypothetical protein